MMKNLLGGMTVIAILAANPVVAFEIQFTWDGLKSCNSGNPNTVNNPEFVLKDVPAGTAFIKFKLKDKDVPGFNHGGGVVAFNGEGAIATGSFKYKSPCPPGGSHTYEWTATALDKKKGGKKLGVAKASREYPE